jgi:hypothetical protein
MKSFTYLSLIKSDIYIDHNHTARIQNSLLKVSADDLHSLINPTANNPI